MIVYSRVTAQPASEPVTPTEAKAFLRVDGTDEEALITSLITVARQVCEADAGLSFIAQTRTVKLDRFCGDIILPYGPVTAVTSVAYVDGDDANHTLDSGRYTIDTQSGLSKIRVDSDGWPDTNSGMNNVVVTYTAGYTNAAAVPAVIKQAILLTVATLFENRQNVVLGSTASLVPWTAQRLLDTVRVYWNAEV